MRQAAFWSGYGRGACGVLAAACVGLAVAGCSSTSRFDFPAFNLTSSDNGNADLAATAALPVPEESVYSSGSASDGQLARTSLPPPSYTPRPSAAVGGEHDGGLVSLVNQADVALLQGAEERLQVAGKAEDGLDALAFDCSCHQLRTEHALPPPGHWAARRRAQPNAVAAAAEGPKRPLREVHSALPACAGAGTGLDEEAPPRPRRRLVSLLATPRGNGVGNS